MMRRLTIGCGILTAAVAFAVTVQSGQSFIQPQTAAPVTVIPDQPVKDIWPPVKVKPPVPPPPLKGLPPRPHPSPMHQTTSSAAPRPLVTVGRTVGRAVGVVRTLLGIPRLIGQRLAAGR